MNKLNTAVNLTRHDDLYQMIIDMHEGLTDAECRRADARLILLLANQVGDAAVVAEAIAVARGTEGEA